MKKSRIISVALTLALVLTTVFAGTEGVFADTTMRAGSNPSTTVKALANEDGSITATDMNSTTTAETYSVKYSKDKPFAGAVKIPKAGTFEFNIVAGADTTVALFDSLTATDPVATQNIYQSYGASDFDSFYVKAKKAGTYYIAFYTNSATECTTSFNAYYAPKQVSSLKLGKTYWAGSTNGGYVYYKVKAPSTGYFTTSFSAGYAGETSAKYYVKVMNSSKSKNLLKSAETVGINKNLCTFSAVKGGTYYIAVKTSNLCYQMNIKFNKVTENSGSSRAKAKSIYKGGTKKGTILATQTSSNADWYKIKINSSQLVKLDFYTYTGGTSGGFRISVYSGTKTKAFGSADFYYGDPGDVLSLTTKINGIDTGRLQKGTYYIKVQKYGNANGYYKLQWK